jgi:hypothetical protein
VGKDFTTEPQSDSDHHFEPVGRKHWTSEAESDSDIHRETDSKTDS